MEVRIGGVSTPTSYSTTVVVYRVSWNVILSAAKNLCHDWHSMLTGAEILRKKRSE
jgi:hypothetical protein